MLTVRRCLLGTFSALLACQSSAGQGPGPTASPPVSLASPAPTKGDMGAAEALAKSHAVWRKLPTVPYKGKQDDVFFLTPDLGWYVNGFGRIYKTSDGGQTWAEKWSKQGTYFRAIGFANEKHGFVGNLGKDYFPGVTDDIPLYETLDGGDTWAPAKNIPLPKGAGVCSIDIVRDEFINAGLRDHRTVIHVAGRVGGPAWLLRSVDEGTTWSALDLNPQAAMILDVKFFDASTGIVVAGSDREDERSHALLLRTQDGGTTWTKVFESSRLHEISWKTSFATREVGYATVQSYDEDAKTLMQHVAKTADNGKSWVELPLVDDKTQREFGVGFASADVGWVGAMSGSYQTTDGGKSWTHVDMGRAVNKIRIVKAPNGFVGYAIGTELWKIDARVP